MIQYLNRTSLIEIFASMAMIPIVVAFMLATVILGGFLLGIHKICGFINRILKKGV
jgi:hypothetical protein